MAETVKGPILHLCVEFQTTQQANVVSPTSTIASTVNLLLPTTVVSLLVIVHLCRTWYDRRAVAKFSLSPRFETKFQWEVSTFIYGDARISLQYNEMWDRSMVYSME